MPNAKLSGGASSAVRLNFLLGAFATPVSIPDTELETTPPPTRESLPPCRAEKGRDAKLESGTKILRVCRNQTMEPKPKTSTALS